MKWYQDGAGNASMMRITGMISAITGVIAVITGLIGFMLNNPQAGAVVASGAGLVSIVLTAKAWQAKNGG